MPHRLLLRAPPVASFAEAWIETGKELPSGDDLDVARLGKPYTQQQLSSEIAKVLVT